MARQTAVIDGGQRLRRQAKARCRPLNPAWDHRFLEIIDGGRLAELDRLVQFVRRRTRAAAPRMRSERGWRLSRLWQRRGPTRHELRYYKPAAELIAGFAIRTAVPAT